MNTVAPGFPDASRTSTATVLPFPWRASGLEPLPWFPFTVAASRGHAPAAGRIAQRAERAYWQLRRLLGFTPRFRLLVLAPSDWTNFAAAGEPGVAQFTAEGHLLVGATPAASWHDVSGYLAGHLPAVTLRGLNRVHGRDAVHADGPDLTGVAETLVAGEIARVIAAQAGAAFGRRRLADAFANYALVAVLGETDPGGLHRLGTLAEAARLLPGAGDLCSAAAAPADESPQRVRAVLDQLALARVAFAAYAQAHTAPLARWFALACEPGHTPPDADHELGRLLARNVHPAIGALVACGPDPTAPLVHAA